MVVWIFCECGKVVDQFEESCHWCGRPVQPEDYDPFPPRSREEEGHPRMF